VTDRKDGNLTSPTFVFEESRLIIKCICDYNDSQSHKDRNRANFQNTLYIKCTVTQLVCTIITYLLCNNDIHFAYFHCYYSIQFHLMFSHCAFKSFRVIICVRMELLCVVLERVSATIIRIDILSDIILYPLYLYPQITLGTQYPCPKVHQ
jgi:hypothetical protein